MAKNKFYVVWQGKVPGVYNSWDTCKKQVEGFEGAQYKGFPTEAEAHAALSTAYQQHINKKSTNGKPSPKSYSSSSTKPNLNSMAVDAACSGNPGKMEYRGVDAMSGAQLFHQGPFEMGTNNIGEFLALVHGLALLKKMGSDLPIYSDSQNAISWVKQKKCKTKLEQTSVNAPIFDLIKRAEKWLVENMFSTPILKWETKEWGEIPADFGRK